MQNYYLDRCLERWTAHRNPLQIILMILRDPNVVLRYQSLLLGYHFDAEGGGVAFKIELAGEC